MGYRLGIGEQLSDAENLAYSKKPARSISCRFGRAGGGRTHTVLPPGDFKSS